MSVGKEQQMPDEHARILTNCFQERNKAILMFFFLLIMKCSVRFNNVSFVLQSTIMNF